MFINIITPCSRPENLKAISDSINIPSENYRWIVVFDAEEIPGEIEVPNKAEVYAYSDKESISGNSQRNYAIDKVESGYLLFLDDDTVLHPNFWSNVQGVNEDLVCWMQCEKDGSSRLPAGYFNIGAIDSGSFMTKREVIGDDRWALGVYEADGIFAKRMASKTSNICVINSHLSIYNYLR